MKYAKVRQVKSLSRGSSRSAGIDFCIPAPTTQFVGRLFDLNGDAIILGPKSLIIKPHAHVLIPSGIVTNLQSSGTFLYDDNKGLALIAHNKSSIGIKQLDVAATVVDEDYQGEIHLSLTNTSSTSIELLYEQKAVQFILVPIIIEDFEEISVDALFDKASERGTSGFGSTSTK